MRSPLSLSRVVFACTLLAAPRGLAADPQPTTPLIANETVVQVPVVHPASAEVFRPAPLPNEDLGSPATKVASDEPNLRPDLLRMRESGGDVMSDTTSEFQRAGRTAPAGGMRLSIPMQ